MKLKVATKSLDSSLRKLLTVVDSRSTLSILNNIFLSAHDGVLTMTTTDLEVTIRTSLEVVVEEEGETTIPGKTFASIVASFTAKDVELETDLNMTTSISCGRAFFKIMGLDPSEFPRQAEFDEGQQLVFNKQEFAKTLKKVGYAVSTDPSRMSLNGILLSVKESSVTTVATDGRRLTLVEKIVDTSEGLAPCEVILPTKVVNELQKLLTEEGDITIKLAESYATFIMDNTVLTSKLIDGAYPNYRQVIPASFTNTISLPREEFAGVLNRVSIVAEGDGSSVKFALEEGQCTLSAVSAEIGEAKESFQLSYTGEPVTISFNPAYLKDPLKNLDCDEVTIRFNDEFKPVVVLGDEGFLYVIMPMRN